MQKTAQFSLFTAILININTIIGAGLFINPKPLTQLTGSLGFVTYFLAALILLPLIISIAELATLQPTAGGLYIYSHKYISPFAGFVSGWCYFLGKSTSAGLLAFTFASFIKGSLPCLHPIPTIAIAIAVLFSLITLNISGVRIGGKIQWLFITLKSVPISFVVLTSIFYYLQPPSFQDIIQTQSDFFAALPTAIFAVCGFETICSIAHLIKNPETNVRRAIVTSFLLVASIAALFQFGMYAVLGDSLATGTQVPILAYGEQVVPAYPTLARLLNAFVYSSIIGGSFGMLTSNCWNLHTIAKNGHLPFSNVLSRLSATNVPWVCLLVEVSASSIILLITAEQTPLQNMAVLGMTVAYILSAVSAFKMSRINRASPLKSIIPIAAIFSCSYIAWLCLKRIMTSGFSYFFLILLATGIVIAALRMTRKQ